MPPKLIFSKSKSSKLKLGLRRLRGGICWYSGLQQKESNLLLGPDIGNTAPDIEALSRGGHRVQHDVGDQRVSTGGVLKRTGKGAVFAGVGYSNH